MSELEQRLTNELSKLAGQYEQVQKEAAEWRETTKLLAEDRQKMIVHLTKLTDAYDTLTEDLRELFR